MKPVVTLNSDDFLSAVKQWTFMNTIDDTFLKDVEIAYIPENFFGPDWWRYSAYLVFNDGRVLSAAVDGSVQEILGLSYRNIISFACGYDFVLALSSNGAIYAQEADPFGPRPEPAIVDLIPALCSIKQVACGVRHSIAVTSKGEVYRWGTHDKNFCKTWRKETFEVGAMKEDNLVPIKKVACGLKYTMAVSMEGDLFAWGDNTSFQLGIEVTASQLQDPCRLALPIKVTDVACGWRHTICLSSQGTMYSWGENAEGQLGLGDETDRITPTKIEQQIGRVIEIAAITIGSGCRTDGGTVYVWGRTKYNKPKCTICLSIHEAFAVEGSIYMHKPLERQHLPALPPKFGSQLNLRQDSVQLRPKQQSNLRVQSMDLERNLELNVLEKERKHSSSLDEINQGKQNQEAEPWAFQQLVQDLTRLSVSLGAEIEDPSTEQSLFSTPVEEEEAENRDQIRSTQKEKTNKARKDLQKKKTPEPELSKDQVSTSTAAGSKLLKPRIAPKPVGVKRSISTTSNNEKKTDGKLVVARSNSAINTVTSSKDEFDLSSGAVEHTNKNVKQRNISKKRTKELLKRFEK